MKKLLTVLIILLCNIHASDAQEKTYPEDKLAKESKEKRAKELVVTSNTAPVQNQTLELVYSQNVKLKELIEGNFKSYDALKKDTSQPDAVKERMLKMSNEELTGILNDFKKNSTNAINFCKQTVPSPDKDGKYVALFTKDVEWADQKIKSLK